MDRTPKQYKKQLEMSRQWKQANPERHAELARAYRRRNPEKIKAQNILNYAIRKGEMSRSNCEGCGTGVRVHAHHYDYAKPLDVRWLCYKCHKANHPVSDENKAVKFVGAKRAQLIGEQNPNAHLSDKAVIEIEHLLNLGLAQERIAAVYGVSQMTVSRIKRGLRSSPSK